MEPRSESQRGGERKGGEQGVELSYMEMRRQYNKDGDKEKNTVNRRKIRRLQYLTLRTMTTAPLQN